MRGRHVKRRMSGALDASAQYLVTLIMEPQYNFIQASTLVECPLVYKDGDIQLKRPSNPMEGVDVGYDAFTNQAFPEISALVMTNSKRCPFSVVALCGDDPVAVPVAFDFYVDIKLFVKLKSRSASKDVAGEMLITSLLIRGYQEHQLLFRTHMENCTLQDVSDAKRQRLDGNAQGTKDPIVLESYMTYEEARVMRHVEHFSDRLTLKHPVDPENSSYAFCFRSKAFVTYSELRPKMYDEFDVLPNMRFIVGARNTGKTLQVCSLVRNTLNDDVTDLCPSYMLPINTTLIVAPNSLVHQWTAALSKQHGLRVHIVTNMRAYNQMTLEKLLKTDAIVTTHAFFASHTQSDKHTVSRAECAKLRRVVHNVLDCARTRVPFAAVWWRRIVIDEVQQFYVEHSVKWFMTATSTLTRMWWCLQGGLARTSHKLFFAAEMLQHGLNYVELPPADSTDIIELPDGRAATPSPSHHIISTPLNATERDVYDLMQQTSCSVEWLKLVCNGEMLWITRYMRPVQFWLDAASQGLDALKASMMTSNHVRVSRVNEEDDDEDGAYGSEESEGESVYEEDFDDIVVRPNEQEDDELGPVNDPATDPVNDPVHEDETHSAPNPADEEEEEESADNIYGPVVNPAAPTIDSITTTITTTLSSAIQRRNARIMERQAFFMRTVMALVNGTEQVQQCSICLCGDANCIFVCGHTMCHECVVQVFERDQSGDFTSCPTCRWEIEASDVFWVTPAPNQSSKATALVSLLRMLLPHHHVLVVSLDTRITKIMQHHLVRAGISNIKLLPPSPATLLHTSPPPTRPHVHFVSYEDMPGLKLPFISHVILLSPLASDQVNAAEALSTVVSSLNPTKQAHVYHLIAADTLEAASIQ